MLAHIVTFTFTDGTPTERIEAAWAELQALPALVPSLRAMHGGIDVGIATGNAQLAIVAFFDDADGWTAYQEHPEHVRVGRDHIRPILAGRSAVQCTWDGPLPG